MLKRLTHEEWWTDVGVMTDANGVVKVDAFKGDYKISAGDSCVEVKLEDDVQLDVVLA